MRTVSIDHLKLTRHPSLAVFLSYFLCSLVFTFPLILRLTTHVPGQEVEGDVPTYIWNLWWMQQALTGGISPFFCEFIFAPYGVSLVFHAFVFVKALLAVPMQWFCTAWTAYNILILGTFTLAGWGMFLLAHHLTRDRRAAWVAGLIFAFSPYMLTRSLCHFNYLSSEWIPLYVLCLIRLLETKSLRWAWGGALCLLLTAYCEYYYLIYLFLFTFFFLGWRFFNNRAEVLNRTFLVRFTLMGAAATAGFAPVLWALLGNSQGGYLYGGWGASAKYGADLLAFITPPPGSLLYGDIGAELYRTFSGGNSREGTVFAGYVALGLAAVCALRLRGNQEVRPWLWLTLGAFLLSLGPLLHVAGNFVFGTGEWRFAVPMPYLGVRYLPLIKGARVAARIDIMVMLGLAVLSAFCVRYLLARTPRPLLWTAAIPLSIGLEYLRMPYPVAPVDIPPAYAEIARDRRDLTVMEVPLGWRTGWGTTGRPFDRQQLYQTVHGKRLLGGFVTRLPDSELQKMTALPGIGQLLALQEDLPPPFSETAARKPFIRAQLKELLPALPEFLRERILGDASVSRFLSEKPKEEFPPSGSLRDLVEVGNLGYVVMHPPYSGYPPIKRYLEEELPLEQFFEGDGVVAYRVRQQMETTGN
ncbi:MAG: hypothetical protein OXH50_18745 [Gemmatimonadetes bacterium]|nr:hypothetical protein [Gemmatimonadota bacterium]